MKRMLLTLFFSLMVLLGGFTPGICAADKVTVVLDWFVNPDHGPLFVALENHQASETEDRAYAHLKGRDTGPMGCPVQPCSNHMSYTSRAHLLRIFRAPEKGILQMDGEAERIDYETYHMPDGRREVGSLAAGYCQGR